MKYKNRDDTFLVRQVTPDELGPDPGPDPEFRVTVSRMANGWWTRAELTRLHAKIGAELARPVPQADEHGMGCGHAEAPRQP